ncbi:hypothetical protein AAFN88_21185 [Pelagibius sp. CAU 1746]|uniref:hypothetical protein n=1 Tax=Pelagibius sp. CAU 1746 TaxID=3140370 RepID=UPI00325BD90B
MNTSNIAVALALSAALGGCAAQPMATQAEVQKAEPLYSGTFTGNYQSLSACIAQAWSRADAHVWDLRQVIDAPNETAVIQGNYRIFAFAYPVHATLQQLDAQTVSVEFRQPPDSKDAPDWVWKAVQDCSGRAS